MGLEASRGTSGGCIVSGQPGENTCRLTRGRSPRTTRCSCHPGSRILQAEAERLQRCGTYAASVGRVGHGEIDVDHGLRGEARHGGGTDVVESRALRRRERQRISVSDGVVVRRAHARDRTRRCRQASGDGRPPIQMSSSSRACQRRCRVISSGDGTMFSRAASDRRARNSIAASRNVAGDTSSSWIRWPAPSIVTTSVAG